MNRSNGSLRSLGTFLAGCGVLTWLAASLLAQPAGGRIAEIHVRGNNRMTTNAILEKVKVRVGDTFDPAIAQADVQRLLDTNRFFSVTMEKTQAPEGIVLTFVIVERPAITQIVFKGNKAFDFSALSGELGFSAGGPLGHETAEIGRQALLKKYHSEGYHFAEVTLDPAALEERQELLYTVVEGPQVKIRKILVEGNHFFSTFRIKWDISTSARFWPFIKGYLDVEQVEADVTKIRNLYVDEGYLDAEVGRRFDFSDNKKDVRITFFIREGDRYRVNEVIFQGSKVFSSETLAGRIKLHQGEFLTTLGLRRDLKALQDTYGEYGYIDARVDVRKRFLDPQKPPPAWAAPLGKPGLLDVVFTIEESDQYHIGQVIIRGNNVTQDRVIRRQLTFAPPQLYDTRAVNESRRYLEEMRLFEKVDITPTGKAPGVRDALVQVTEGKTAEFMVGVGISSRDGLLGNISFAQRNFDLFAWPGARKEFSGGEPFKGAGQTLRVTLEPGVDVMRASIDWFEPFLMDQPYTLGVRAFAFNRTWEDYDETRYGALGSLGHSFKNRWYAELAARVEAIDISNLADDAPPEAREVEGTNTLLGLKGALTRNRTDSRWLPSTGDHLYLSYEQVAGDFQFGRANVDYHIYGTVYTDALERKHILAGRASLGQIVGDAPLFERLYGGGLGSVRGFRYRGISPRSVGTDKAIGGNFSLFLGGEYSAPLVAELIRGVVFLDSGTVEKDTSIGTYRVSAGFGLRWIIPFFGQVPMSLDFAWPLLKDPQDDTQVFSFSLGWTF